MGHSLSVALASWLRRSIDYLRYLEPRYRDADRLRRRARRKAPKAMPQIGTRRDGLRRARASPRCARRSRRSSAACRRRRGRQAFLEEHRPGHPPPRAPAPDRDDARRLPPRREAPRDPQRVFPVRGWDNLTNKGLLRDAPDAVLAWNDLQAKEAVELHRIPRGEHHAWSAPRSATPGSSASRAGAAGGVLPGASACAPTGRSCSTSARRASSPRTRSEFVRDWIERLRARGEPFAEAGFLVRPHPLNAAQWADADLGDPNAKVWPRFGEAPHDEESRENYFDSIYHSDAVVGINTTAQIESAIVGRPVHTILAEEFRDTQQGTLHFHYLKADEFGLLHVARTSRSTPSSWPRRLRGRGRRRAERALPEAVRPAARARPPARELIVDAIEAARLLRRRRRRTAARGWRRSSGSRSRRSPGRRRQRDAPPGARAAKPTRRPPS